MAGVSLSPHDLQQVDIFRDLTPPQLEHVSRLGTLVHISPGTVFLKSGDRASTVYAVCDGQAELHASTRLGEITVRIISTGESFPIVGLIGGGRVITSAQSMTDMEVVAFPADALWDQCDKEPDIGLRVYRRVAEILAERYRSTLGRLTNAVEGVLYEV